MPLRTRVEFWIKPDHQPSAVYLQSITLIRPLGSPSFSSLIFFLSVPPILAGSSEAVPPACGWDGRSTSPCQDSTGLSASLKWCWCFHFPWQPVFIVALLVKGAKEEKKKRDGAWIWSAHSPVFSKFSLSPNQHPAYNLSEYHLYYYSLITFSPTVYLT